jgi:DNA-binding HxlR family transcriptional regulator
MTAPFPASAYCPVFQASLEFLGARWTASILRVLFARKLVRFTDLLEAVPRLSSRLLSQRLDELTAAGVVTRLPGNGHPRYALTDKGRDLSEVFAALERWNRRWAVPPEASTVTG